MVRSTKNVQIGMDQYITIKETMEVFRIIPARYDYDHPLNPVVRKQYYREIKKHTPKWNEVRKLVAWE